ncbi:archaeal proteasome endopeptidase complex subunit alpha [Saliphagus sp. LR7]|uniref:archaeal proteasome endopeptidase complex subunit alpha n=1 Tax=Saliphagus sp. LR7 TaxID=2282654 RepID=UPI000DF7F050|nr:archaeal proteasome endopeptidase complex subunit alpha [Saliphagus sp. LR7]
MEPDRQAYDRGQTIFSPDGRLYQVEYAREAVSRGSPSVGVRTAEGPVLAARRPLRSPLIEPESVAKIHEIDDHAAVAAAGHAADARRLVEVGREAATGHRIRYDEPIGTDALARAVADHVQEHTQTGGSRPYGTALLVAGTDGGLFEVDPGGTVAGWRAGAIGADAREVRSVLAEGLEDEPGTLDRGIELALGALAREDSLEPEEVAVATPDAGEPATFSRLSSAEIDRFTPAS